jgi:Fe-S cluster assembly protein SufD
LPSSSSTSVSPSRLRKLQSHPLLGTLIPVNPIHTVDICSLKTSATIPPISLKKNTHLCIVLENDVETAINVTIERGDRSSSSHALEVFLGDRASLTLRTLTQSSVAHIHIAQLACIKEQSHLLIQNFTIGGTIEHTCESSVHGTDATSSIDWLSCSGNEGILTLSAKNLFHAERGEGEICMKGIAKDLSQTTLNGMIEIGPRGKHTNAFLREDALILSKDAKVDAIPALEIKTNDVKASHSATVSTVSQDDLFYFQSRGIEKADAQNILIEGFLHDVLDRITDVSFKQEVLHSIAE